MAITGFYWVSWVRKRVEWLLLGLTGFEVDFMTITGFYRVLLGSIRAY